MSTSLFSKTPTVAVLNNRGLTVRDIAYHRHPDTPDVTNERLARHCYDAHGSLTQSADPRLHQAGVANFSYFTSLTGAIRRTQGVDNGTAVSLNDAAGRPFIAVSNISTADDGTEDLSQALIRTRQYENTSLPGRPLSITEQVAGEMARITERFVYAGNTDAEKALNLAGECVRHYDTAGLVLTGGRTLTGGPLSITRRLLKNADNPDIVADWQYIDTLAWNSLLVGETEEHTTLTTADAAGSVLTTTDAKGNVQRVAYDVAGLLSGSWLALKDGPEQVIVASLTYSAAGQKLREEHGNGVVTTFTYEPETQRLTGIKTARPAGHASGAKVLQDLRYQYDPVGNVLKVCSDAEETRFWRNQKVMPENAYTYDSLYQLVCATGREMAGAGQQCCHLPAAIIPLPADNNAYTTYTRTYCYDDAGNLTQVRHFPATGSGYTTNITLSNRSNRGVLSTLTENPAEVDALFTAGGQQRQIRRGQSLIWTPRNELWQVAPVVRAGNIADREVYRYDAGNQRILKVSVQKTGGSTQTQRTLFLPGLELRTTTAGEKETESLQVITVGEAGRAQVRVLHWTAGKPDEISNNPARWSYNNLTGSIGLEVDGAGEIISREEYYPYGGTAILTSRSAVEAVYRTVRYSGKERDATGLYYYGFRYYQPWAGRWLSADPAGTIDGLNLFRMVRNNPILLHDPDGRMPKKKQNADDIMPSEPGPSHQQSMFDSGSLATAAKNTPDAVPERVTSGSVKKTGKISFFKKIFSKKKQDEKKVLDSDPDKDFETVNIRQSDVDKVAMPVNGPVNLRKPFDHKRWVTNAEEIFVYRQDQRPLDEIINAGGFYPRTLEIGTLEDHAHGSRQEYSFVSTSTTRLTGGSFGKYEYKIKLNPHQAVNLPATLEKIHGRKPQEYRINEYSVPGFITPSQIVGWRKCKG